MAEWTAAIGDSPGERCEGRLAQRNGPRPKLVSAAAGDITVPIRKLGRGSLFPSILERRRRIDRALFAVTMEAWVQGSRPARSTTWSRPWGRRQGSPSPRCPDLRGARRRPRGVPHPAPGGPVPCVFAYAAYVKGRVVFRAVVVAAGVTATRGREVLRVEVRNHEDETSLTAFLRSLRARGQSARGPHGCARICLHIPPTLD